MSLQLCRYMQTVCCHSKLTASVSLANHVPLVKKALEVFVYRFSKKNVFLSSLVELSLQGQGDAGSQ